MEGLSYFTKLALSRHLKSQKIHHSASLGDAYSIELLLNNGYDVNRKDEEGKTALLLAIEKDHQNCVKLLLANNAKDEGNKALQLAMEKGHMNCVKLFLDYNANDENSIMHSVNNVECLRELVRTQNMSHINKKFEGGNTPLHVAAKEDFCECLQTLIESGANIHAVNNDGNEPIHLAALNGSFDCLKLLVENGSNVNCKGNSMKTPLHFANSNGHLDCSNFLISKGADVNEAI
jgi:ankyrin repeat protein